MSVSIGQMYSIRDLDYPNATSYGTGAVLTPTFVAPSLTNAQAVAQIFSTLFQRSIRLCPLSAGPPYPIFNPSASMALSNAPSSISW